MSDDLEPIPIERPGSEPAAGPAPSPPVPGRSPRRRRAIAVALGLAAIAGVGGWRLSGGDHPAPGPGRASGRAVPAVEDVEIAYPAVRGVPPHLSTVDELLVTRSDVAGIGTLLLVDRSGQVVWELPRVGAWDPTPVAWSPDGRRFLFHVSRGQETVPRVVMLPEGVDLPVRGALAWIGDNELLVWRDGRLGRLDVASSALVEGEPLTQYVSAQAGSPGQAALVIISDGRTLVRFVDHALRIRDTPAPAGIVDCFSPVWHDDGRRLLLACKRFEPPDTAAFEIDARTLRWSRLDTDSLQPAAVHPVLGRSLVVETVGNCGDNPIDLWLLPGSGFDRRDRAGAGAHRLNDDGTGPSAEADVAPDSATVAAVNQPCGPTPHIVVISLADGSRRDLTLGRRPLWSPARR